MLGGRPTGLTNKSECLGFCKHEMTQQSRNKRTSPAPFFAGGAGGGKTMEIVRRCRGWNYNLTQVIAQLIAKVEF